MKKILSLILTISIIATFAVFALGSGSSETKEQGTGTAEGVETNTNVLGDYQIDILSCRLAKDYENKDVVIVKYNYTNVSDDSAASFSLAFMDSVYQNGVGLNKAYVLNDSANYSSDNQNKEIKKGASIEVEVAYELNDTTTDIEVEVSEFISLNEDVVKKTFTIA
ncbi:MAG: DUF5067 domain-containing protein [Clostridia bacterium]|nr:DUF5067 domain-containing protein [Clostridia bacterium]